MRAYHHVDWEVVGSLAGKLPDARVADLAGCNYMTVLRYRQMQGIPALKRRGLDWAKYKALEEEGAPVEVVAKLIKCPIRIAEKVVKVRGPRWEGPPPPERFNYNGVMQTFWEEVGAKTYAEKVFAWSVALRVFKEEELQQG